ncbi:hypothetical protein [Hungatella hathewayi]|uniref:hypothetical protein n=1 Tax=Hungatella hathewayi TaxID=154046 RepID=UPI00356660DC
MKIILSAKEKMINLCDYELFLPIINNMWIFPKNSNLYSTYKYNPDTGVEISETNPDTWYPQAIKDMVLLDPTGYSLGMNDNKIKIFTEDQMDSMQVLIDYEERQCKNCPNRLIGAFDEGFCNISGYSKSENSNCEATEKNIFKYGNVYGKDIKKDMPTETKEKLNNQAIAWKSDAHFTEGKRYECTNTYNNMIDILDDHGKSVAIDLEDRDFTFILYPRETILEGSSKDNLQNQVGEKLDDLIIRYRKNLTSLYDELDETKEYDIFVKTGLLETIIEELVMIKNPNKLKLKVGDYVEGYESYGPKEGYIRGTIKAVEYNLDGSIRRCDIQCDDGWNGARGNGLNPRKEINKIERVPEWWKTINRFNVPKEKEEQAFEFYKKKKTFIQLYYGMCPSDIDIFNNRYQEVNLKKDFSPEELYSFVQEAEKNGVLEEMLSYIKSLLK